uniref:Immunoglobulin V-set domain-containing protein n=1 Tax=Cyprinus carpio TaxID=7962 RepID=A0A8C2KTU7_CYPCA
MSVNHLLLLLIFLLTIKTGFSDVFVQTGASIQLDIKTQELPKIHVLVWGKDKSATILTFINATKEAIRDGSYKERVEFNTETFSVTLKNMQKTDSGLYTARAIEDNNKFFAEYKVSVIDAVEAPVLTVISNWSSSDSCTVNFTCRAPELMINSSYQNNRCSPQEVTSHEIHNLTLDCSKKYIICNHSNPVSWKQDRVNIKELCVNKEENPEKRKQSSPLWLGVGVGVPVTVFFLILFGVILYLKYKKGTQKEVVEGSTVYAQVEVQEMKELNSECNTYDMPDRAKAQEETGDKRPNTTYCTVGQHKKSAIPRETDHTIYSAVYKQSSKKPPAITSDDA